MKGFLKRNEYKLVASREKLDYIHNNPVEEMIVEKPENYLFSSARNYADMDGLLEVVLEIRKVRSY
jgi:hypothetical protein